MVRIWCLQCNTHAVILGFVDICKWQNERLDDMQSIRYTLLWAALWIGSFCITACEGKQDFSTFTHFAYRQAGGMGFCPAVGTVSSMQITHQYNGDYVLNLSTFELGKATMDACIATVTTPQQACVVEVKSPERILSLAEVKQMQAVLKGVTFTRWGSGQLYEECLIQQFQWDSSTFDTYAGAGNGKINYEQAQVLLRFIHSLDILHSPR